MALADDATAAVANPAGLVQLSRPEVSLEGRLWNYSTPFPEGGRISGQPTGNLLDNSSGLRTGVSSETLAGLSFISFVYPHEKWSLTVYRHQSANFEAPTETQGLFSDPIPLNDLIFRVSAQQVGETLRIGAFRTFTDIEISTYGVAGAYSLTETFSLGGGLSYFDGTFTSTAAVFAAIDPTLPDGPFGRNVYAEEARVASAETTTIDNSDWGFTGGFLWNVTGQWSVGGSYREGLKFELNQQVSSGPILESFVPVGTPLVSDTSPLEFPDVYGLGVAFKSHNGVVTASFEWDYVQYSSFVESLNPDVIDIGDVALDDGNELRVGFEYAFLQSAPVIALRVGA